MSQWTIPAGLKVGVGITTTPKRQINGALFDNTDSSAVVSIFNDEDGRGVSHARNTLLNQLSDCDYIFLFDDDCYPVMKGWEGYFITQATLHSVDFISLFEYFKSQPIRIDGEMGRWDSGLGCFNMQSKKALDIIGGYNTQYQRYGYEDSARNQRAMKAGLTGGSFNSCPIRAMAYIHSMDVFAENPTPNLTWDEKKICIDANRDEWIREIQSEQLHYSFA